MSPGVDPAVEPSAEVALFGLQQRGPVRTRFLDLVATIVAGTLPGLAKPVSRRGRLSKGCGSP